MNELLRQRQGRPRRAARSRPSLSARRSAHGRSGGWPLTVFLTPDAAAVLRRDLLSPGRSLRDAGLPQGASGRLRRPTAISAAKSTLAAAELDGCHRRRRRPASPQRRRRDRSELLARAPREARRAVRRRATAASARGPKFPNTMASTSCCVARGDRAARAQGTRRRCARAAFGTSSAAAFTATRPTSGGSSRTSRRCSTTTRSSCASTWTAGARLRRAQRYDRTARDIAAYVAREMTSPEGGFYATQDADSEGEEGKFFVWTPAEVDAACGGDDEARARREAAFGVSAAGNFEGSIASVLSTPIAARPVARALAIARRASRPRSSAPAPRCSRRARSGPSPSATRRSSRAGTA